MHWGPLGQRSPGERTAEVRSAQSMMENAFQA